MNDETKKHLQKLETDFEALRCILDSPPHEGRHTEAQAAFRVARLTFGKLVDALGDAPKPEAAPVVSLRDYEPTAGEIYDACMQANHEFGLLSLEAQAAMMAEAKSLLCAWGDELRRRRVSVLPSADNGDAKALAEAQGVAPAKPDIETPISATVRDALERVLERIAREALGQ